MALALGRGAAVGATGVRDKPTSLSMRSPFDTRGTVPKVIANVDSCAMDQKAEAGSRLGLDEAFRIKGTELSNREDILDISKLAITGSGPVGQGCDDLVDPIALSAASTEIQ